MSELEEQIKQKRRELSALETQLEAERNPMRTDQGLADFLHSVRCKQDHTDQCGYHYVSWETKDPHLVRLPWLRRARRIRAAVEHCGLEDGAALELLREILATV